MTSHTRLPKSPKSSPDARRLLEAVYRQEGSWRKVADRLGLRNSGNAWSMARGTLADTKEMKAVLRLARRRERMAFAGLKLPKQETDVQAELLKQVLQHLKQVNHILSSLEGVTDAKANPNNGND